MVSVKNFKQTFILILAMILGTIIGLVLGEKSSSLSPFGDLFLNLLLVIIPPLIFLTIATSIAKMTTPKRLRENTFYHTICNHYYFNHCSCLWYFDNLSLSVSICE